MPAIGNVARRSGYGSWADGQRVVSRDGDSASSGNVVDVRHPGVGNYGRHHLGRGLPATAHRRHVVDVRHRGVGRDLGINRSIVQPAARLRGMGSDSLGHEPGVGLLVPSEVVTPQELAWVVRRDAPDVGASPSVGGVDVEVLVSRDSGERLSAKDELQLKERVVLVEYSPSIVESSRKNRLATVSPPVTLSMIQS